MLNKWGSFTREPTFQVVILGLVGQTGFARSRWNFRIKNFNPKKCHLD